MNPAIRKLLMQVPPVRDQFAWMAALEGRFRSLDSNVARGLATLDQCVGSLDALALRIAALEERIGTLDTNMARMNASLMGLTRRSLDLNEAQFTAIRAAISAAPLSEYPFPHFIARNVLPAHIIEQLLDDWPPESAMRPEPGDLGRYMLPIPPNPEAASVSDFLHGFGVTAGQTVVEASLARFQRYNARRFGQNATYQTRLDLFESGPDFAQHHAHNHHSYGPGWVMTFLLFLDDGGRTDRGEVFSAPVKGTEWLNVVAQGPTIDLRPMKRIAFEPNTLLAWLDGPMSFHGTDMLPTDPVNRRRMLRCHANVDERFVEDSLGINSLDFMNACKQHYEGASEPLRAILARPNNCIEALPRFAYADA
jgi:hypothetical protein